MGSTVADDFLDRFTKVHSVPRTAQRALTYATRKATRERADALFRPPPPPAKSSYEETMLILKLGKKEYRALRMNQTRILGWLESLGHQVVYD